MYNQNPKYYRALYLGLKNETEVEHQRGHKQINPDLLTGEIQAVIETLQPLHIGTGVLAPPDKVGLTHDVPLVKTFYRASDRLTIPGSSLKGAVRSFVEMITHSCVSKFNGRTAPNNLRMRIKADADECKYKSRDRTGALCTACKIFGAMGYQGQVTFNDATALEDSTEVSFMPAQYSPKQSFERRYYPHDLIDENPRSWPVEVSTAGSKFSAQVRFHNLTAGELGLILIALGQDTPPIQLKLGAGKSAGFGSIRFTKLAAKQIDTAQLYLSYDTPWSDINIDDCIQRAYTEKPNAESPALIVKRNLSQLRQDLVWTEDDHNG